MKKPSVFFVYTKICQNLRVNQKTSSLMLLTLVNCIEYIRERFRIHIYKVHEEPEPFPIISHNYDIQLGVVFITYDNRKANSGNRLLKSESYWCLFFQPSRDLDDEKSYTIINVYRALSHIYTLIFRYTLLQMTNMDAIISLEQCVRGKHHDSADQIKYRSIGGVCQQLHFIIRELACQGQLCPRGTEMFAARYDRKENAKEMFAIACGGGGGEIS